MGLFQAFGFFGNSLFKAAFKLEKVKTDNTVFRLYYKLSFWLLIFYSTSYMYALINHPINCIGSKSKGKELEAGVGGYRKEVNDFCWVHGTYTVTNLRPDEEFFPGIGTAKGGQESIRYQPSYKWMYIYIVAMMTILYIPRQVWRSFENGRMRDLVEKLNCVLCFRGAKEDIQKEKEGIADYLYSHFGYHRKYAYGFVLGEFLNIIVSLCMMLIWDTIADNEFSMHGGGSFGDMQTPPRLRTDRLARAFPVIGKCTFYTFGGGGDVVPNDFICALSLNLIHEFAAVFFWYWFMMLLAVGICELTFRFGLIGSKRLRQEILSGLTPLTPPEDLETIVKRCTYSDWFVIYQLGSSLEPVIFREIMQVLVRKLHASKFEE